jgi:hypothetical protein
MTAKERVVIKRAKRCHPEWSAGDILAYTTRWKMLDAGHTEADVQAVIDGMVGNKAGQSRMEEM